MASASVIALPSVLFNGSRTHLRNASDVPVSTIPRGRKRCFAVVAKAAGDDSDSSSGRIVKSVQNAVGYVSWSNNLNLETFGFEQLSLNRMIDAETSTMNIYVEQL